MAPVIRALQARPDRFVARTCATAQHREMLDQALAPFGIVPDIDLDLMQPGQTLSALGARVLAAMDEVLAAEQPDWVLVQGDTTTVMMAALAAQHRQVKVGHVEAGLRTYDRRNPFPEEMNRVVADHVSDLCFAPTETARRNLLAEGIPDERIIVTGNTVIDALLWVADQPRPAEMTELLGRLGIVEKTGKQGAPGRQVDEETRRQGDDLRHGDKETRGQGESFPCSLSPPHPLTPSPCLPLSPSPHLILVTAHRRESFGAPLAGICRALRQLSEELAGRAHIIYPVHRNPNVWGPVHAALDGLPGITLLPPVDYRALVYLMGRAALILTDSGGIQEEAPSLHVPVLVLRETTERPETVSAGAARLVGTDPVHIVAAVHELLDDPVGYARLASAANPYGDGHAAGRIAAALWAIPSSD
jgi:UDP-N-acetylglucosamine 2-epimerase (non-hydrolysing)